MIGGQEGISPELEEKIHEMRVSGMMCEERTALQMLLFAGAGEIHVEHSRKHELSATGETRGTRALVSMMTMSNNGVRVHTADTGGIIWPVKVDFIEHHLPPSSSSRTGIRSQCHV